MRPVGGVVPHAGWRYSAITAISVFRSLQMALKPDVLVLFGGHLTAGDPDLVVTEDFWQTPLGDIQIDGELTAELRRKITLCAWPRQYVDNGVEVHLPLIKHFFQNTAIAVLGIAPRAKAADIGQTVADVLRTCGRSALVIGSTDLTHYGPQYGFVPEGFGDTSVGWVKNTNDRRFIDLMIRMEENKVLDEAQSRHNACCPGAVVAAIVASQALGATVGTLLDYRTSYDTHKGDNFVGYAGIVFS